MRKTIFNIILVALMLSIVTSCQYEAPEVQTGPRGDVSILTTIQDNRYNLFVQAVGLAGLTTELDAKESVTVFAPNDDAFNALMLELGVSSLTQVDPQTLAAILRYHIVDSEIVSADLPREIAASNGLSLYVSRDGQAVSLNGKSSVLLTNRFGRNGVFHGINKVITLPTTTVYGAITQRAADVDAPEFTLLKYAIDLAGLNDDLDGGELTIFAPTDAAFDQIGLSTTADLDAVGAEDLAEILSFHILPAAKFTIDFEAREFTLAGSNGFKAIDASETSFGNAAIVEKNIIQTNGVLNTIDAVVFPLLSLVEGLGVEDLSGGFDGFGFDAFGNLISASSYTGLDELEANFSVYTHQGTPVAGAFASSEEIIDYLERHIFEGSVDIPSLADGTKITSIGGDSYYINNVTSLGRRYVNGLRRNAFSNQSLNFPAYNGTAYLYNGGFSPNPDESISEVLAANPDFSLISAAIEVAGKTNALGTGNLTFFAMENSEFEAYTGFTTPEEITALDAEADAELISALAELIDRHTIPIVSYSIKILNDLPTYENVLGEEIFFADVNGSAVIVEDPKDPTNAFVDILSVDIKASNGVIHVVSKGIELAD